MTATFEDVPIDRVRSYWNARPCNIRHSRAPVGERRYFDEVEARKYFVEPHIPGFADFARWKDRRVLEIGCGIGTDTINFARAGAQVTAIDLSERSVEIARQRAHVFELGDRIRFLQANVEQLSEALPVEPFDLVYSFGVLHHTPDPAAALRALRPYLAAGGTLKIMMYHRRSWKVLWIFLAGGNGRLQNLDALIARSSEAQTGCPVTYSYSRTSLARLLRATGYAVDDMFVDHIFPWRIPDYVEHRYRKVWYFRMLPEPVFRAFERRFGWHLCAAAHPA